MPEKRGQYLHLPVTPERRTYTAIKTIVIDAEKGITALYGRPESSDAWEIKTYLFDTTKGWTMETARAWIDNQTDGTQAEEVVEVSDADRSTYIEVRQHPPGKFTSYRHRWLDKAQGIVKSVGQWRKTGAEVVQKLLFRRDHGWTEETVKQWFDDHPEFYYPTASSGLFVALSDDGLTEFTASVIEDAVLTTQEMTTATLTGFEAVVIQGGWGKNRRRGPDGLLYRDYFTDAFLQSLLPLLDESAVQSIKVSPTRSDAAMIPASMNAVIAELQQHGHADSLINTLFRHGLAGNTIGFVRSPEFVPGALGDGTPSHIRAQVVFANSEAAEDSKRLFQSAWNLGLKRALGLSITYRASVDWDVLDGQPACIHQSATHHVSTEFVPNPAAGGKLIAPIPAGHTVDDVVQGDHTAMNEDQKHTEAQDQDDVLTQAEDRPTADQPPAPAPSVPKASPPSQEETPASRGDSVATGQATPANAVPPKDPRLSQFEAMFERVLQNMHTLSEDVATMKQDRFRGNLTTLVTQSDLEDLAKTQILTGIANGAITSQAQVEAMMEVAKANRPAAPEENVPVFPGISTQSMPRAQVLSDKRDLLKIRSYQMWGIPLTQAERDLAAKYRVEPFYGLKDEYTTLTGDVYTRMHGVDPRPFMQNIHPDCVAHSMHYRGLIDDLSDASMSQAILTTTYTDFLTHILNRSLEVHFTGTTKTWQRALRVGESYNDNRDHTHFLLGQFPELDTVAEGGSYTEIESGKLASVTSSSTKKGNYWSISEEAIQDDDLDYVKGVVQQLAVATNRTLEHQVWNKVIGYSTAFNNATMTDDIAGSLYSYANRKNYIDGTVTDFEDVVALINLMLSQTDLMDDAGNEAPIMLTPAIFLANVIHIGKIRAMAKSVSEPGREDNLMNTLYFLNGLPDDNFVGIHPSYLLDHPEFLCILPDPQTFPGIVLKYFRGMQSPELIWEGNQQPAYGSHWSSDTLKLKIKFKYRLYYYKLKAFHGLFNE